MIVLLRPGVSQETHLALVESIRAMDLDARPLELGDRRALEVVGDDPRRVLELAEAEGVEEILTRRTPLEGGEPIWPHFAIRVLIAGLALVIVLALLTAFLPPGLGDRATATPPATAPAVEWYLRPLDVVLGFFPSAPWVGGWLVVVFWLALMLWPFLDRADEETTRGRRAILLIRALGVLTVLVGVLFALGVVS